MVRPFFVALVSLFAVAACSRTATPEGSLASDGGRNGEASHAVTKGGTCGPSSVVTTTACAPRTLPPSNATSDYGCKSDAECKQGRDGRCVKNDRGIYGATVAPSPLLAAPPPPPPKTVCVYDECVSNADCGSKARCACGEGTVRHRCIPLDACLTDAECGKDSLCACGSGAGANTCIFANCRSDKDCDGRTCGASASGTYCHTGDDECTTDKDCKKGNEYSICDYERSRGAWKCRVVPPIPPG